MEDDDDSCHRSMNNTSITTSLLYCHEDPLVSTPPPAAAAAGPRGDDADLHGHSSSVVVGDDEQDDDLQDEILMDYMARQRCYAPSRGYLDHLLVLVQPQGSPSISHAGVSSARSRGVRYIIYAFGRLGLAAATAFNAVNYLDRFLSINCHLSWETWMVELVSVACLSIACKLDEVNIPSLHHLQMEEVMSHSFRPATVRDMELTLLKALQWRLACVTPYSFLQLLLPLPCPSPSAAASRCTRLLIRSLAEPSLLRFDSSVIAASALRCVALQDHHQDSISCHISRLLICPEWPLDNGADECLEMMKAVSTTLDFNTHQMYSDQQSSPISVIPSQTDGGTVNRSAVSRRLFGGSTPQGSTEDEDSAPNRHETKRSHTNN